MAHKYYAKKAWLHLKAPVELYSPAEFFNLPKDVDKSEYHLFDSRGEARRYQELHFLQEQGLIHSLLTQQTYELQPAFKLQGKNMRAIKIVVDFTYYDKDKHRHMIEDFKGVTTAVWMVKWKMLQFMFKTNIELGVLELLVTRK